MTSRTGPLVLVALAILTCPSCESTDTAPSASVALQILYTQPDASTIPPPDADAAMCYHHNAPVNLVVESCAGTSARMDQIDALHYGLRIPDVRTGQECWLTFIDILLCPTGAPRVTKGVAVNGVTLSRLTTDQNGRQLLAFRVDSTGRIVP